MIDGGQSFKVENGAATQRRSDDDYGRADNVVMCLSFSAALIDKRRIGGGGHFQRFGERVPGNSSASVVYRRAASSFLCAPFSLVPSSLRRRPLERSVSRAMKLCS